MLEERDMNSLDTFGSFFARSFRDKSLDNVQGLLDGHWKDPELQSLQNKLSKFSPDQKATVRELVETMLTHSMHDLLFAFQESHDCDTVRSSVKMVGSLDSASIQRKRKSPEVVGPRKISNESSESTMNQGKNSRSEASPLSRFH